MKKILILGGNGFIGKNLCATLAKTDNKVYSFDLALPKEKIDGVEYIEGDFFDDFTLASLLKDKDVIYHAICTMNPGNSNDKYIVGYERDLIQTIKLCDIIKKTNTKMIFLSSGGTVYGIQKDLPISESATPQPINHYGNLKLCIENTIRVFKHQEKSDFVIARVANPYGPGQDYRKGVGFIDAVIKHSINGTPVEIWGDGNVIRDYIYIDDVCFYLAKLADCDANIDVINISSGKGTSQKEIVEAVKALVPELKVVYKDKRSVDADKIVLDNGLMQSIYKKELKSIDVGIQKYFDYVRSNKWD